MPTPYYRSSCTFSDGQNPPFHFRVDPTEIKWGHRLQLSEELSVGGMVKYPMGDIFDDITVTGEVGTGGLKELMRLGEYVQAYMKDARFSGKTLRFKCNPPTPEHRSQRPDDPCDGTYYHAFDYTVFIKTINGLRIDGVTKNYKWNMTLGYVSNNLRIETVTRSSVLRQVSGVNTSAHTHVVGSNETLEGISAKYYGSNNINMGISMIRGSTQNTSAFDDNGELRPGAILLIPYNSYTDQPMPTTIPQPGSEPDYDPFNSQTDAVSTNKWLQEFLQKFAPEKAGTSPTLTQGSGGLIR